MKLLYVKSSPRAGRSHSLAVADAFADAYCQTHPDDRVEIVDVFADDLPVFDAIAYPSILVGAKRNPEAETKTRVARLTHAIRRELTEAGAAENVTTVRERLEELDGLLERNGIAEFPQVLLRREGWVLEDPILVRLCDRLMQLQRLQELL